MTDLNWLLVYDCLDANYIECSIDTEKIYSETVSINMDHNGFFYGYICTFNFYIKINNKLINKKVLKYII